jgi:hypothetical protein
MRGSVSTLHFGAMVGTMKHAGPGLLLATCACAGLASAANAEDPPALPQSMTEVIAEREGLRLRLLIALEPDETIRVTLSNQGTRPVCLDTNFGASSKIVFYDSEHEVLESGGFEGRPVTNCVTFAPGDEHILTYGHDRFNAGVFEKAREICYFTHWRRPEPPEAEGHRMAACAKP